MRNASPIPTLPRHKTLPRATIQRKTTPPVAATIAQVRILAAVATEAEIVAGIAAGVAVGDDVVDAIAADARRVARAGATCLLRSMHPRKASSPADMTIAADNREVMTIGGRKLRAARRLPCQAPPRKRSFFRVNRWQNIAASLPLRQHQFPALSMIPARRRTLPKKLLHAQPAICRPMLRAAAASLDDSPADCLAGSWLMPVPSQKQQPWELPALRRNCPSPAARSWNLLRRRLPLTWKPPAMTLN